jgi:Protein of unknown function (DUF3800)
MAIFQAFVDESGKFKDKSIVSFCGLCSTVSRIAEFEDEWKGILRSYGMSELSMKRALRYKIRLGANVEAKSARERNVALKPFAECVRKHIELGVAITVHVEAYQKWPLLAKQKFAGGSDNPHYFAFLNGLLSCTKYVQDRDRVSLICDDDKETAYQCYRLYDRVRKIEPDIKKSLVAITFADDSVFTPLQGADLLASLCRLEAGRRMLRNYYEFMPLFRCLTERSTNGGMKWCVRFFDKERLDELSQRRNLQGRSPLEEVQ